jgi:hypothetical protein
MSEFIKTYFRSAEMRSDLLFFIKNTKILLFFEKNAKKIIFFGKMTTIGREIWCK